MGCLFTLKVSSRIQVYFHYSVIKECSTHSALYFQGSICFFFFEVVACSFVVITYQPLKLQLCAGSGNADNLADCKKCVLGKNFQTLG